jgi:photosystem II stability/assembly factor-like uncharacterized protein
MKNSISKLFILLAVLFICQHLSFAQPGWNTQSSGTTNSLVDVCFTSTNTGTTVGANGTILHTTNGGTTWISQSSGTTNHLWGVHFNNANSGWAVGANGTILHTTNGGTTWISQSSGTTAGLSDVFFDSNAGWAVGWNGTIRHTANGGGNWMYQSSGTTVSLSGIYFTQGIGAIGTAVGQAGTILVTMDYGSNWYSMPSGTTKNLRDISYHDDKGLAVGEDGVILRSTNPTIWNLVALGSNDLSGVCFIDNSVATAVGDNGTIFRSTDGGLTWGSQSSNTTNDLLGVSFSDANRGTAVGANGTILRTTNGGVTLPPPQISVSPNSCNENIPPGDTMVVTFVLENVAPQGSANLEWNATVNTTMVLSPNNTIPNIARENIDRDAVSSEHASMSLTIGPQSTTSVLDQDVQLILDDGSRENAIGLTNGGQFLWLNRFTPSPSDFPFTLDEIHVLFGAGTGVNVGELVDIYVYEDTDGDGDPGTGANFLGALNNAAVQFVDDVNFSIYSIAPITMNGPGDVLIAVVNRTAGTDPSEYPAAVDQTSSQSRSWIGTYQAGNPPDPPPLPADDLWGIIDSFNFPGNWMIRGFGSTSGGEEFIEILGPTSGSIAPGYTHDLIVRLYGLQPDTTYQGSIVISSNDPINPSVNIPVSVSTVVGIEHTEGIPTTFAVSNNYPNPFNPLTTIDYQLPKVDDVTLVIYNVLGQPVRTLVNERKRPGTYKVVWDGRNEVGDKMSSGVYIYRFEAGDFTTAKKMLLLK